MSPIARFPRLRAVVLPALLGGQIGILDLQAQGTVADYERAAEFLPWNINRLFLHTSVTPTWIGNTDRFWYRATARQGGRFVTVDPEGGTRRPAFDHERLAASLARMTGADVDPADLPFEAMEMGEGEDWIGFASLGGWWRCDLVAYECAADGFAARRAALAPPRVTAASPDGRWAVFVRDHNLVRRSLETGEEVWLTRDGNAGRPYATPVLRPTHMRRADGLAEGDVPPSVLWAPDSRRILTHRLDRRRTKTFGLVEAVPTTGDPRFSQYTYAYVLPGDTVLPTAQLLVFDIERQSRIDVRHPPIPVLYYGPPLGEDRRWWSRDGERLYFVTWDRGYRSATLHVTEAESGETRTVVREEGPTWVDVGPNSFGTQVRVLDGGERLLWWSQRDGWGHVYLLDAGTGRTLARLTGGEWAVREIHFVDESADWVYFTAGGREADRDPYYRHLYRVRLNGSNLELLTPEPADHEITFSPSGRFFLDAYSRMNTVPATVVRRASDGGVVMTLERADLDSLFAAGWSWPEPFSVEGRDGETPVFGLMVRPTTFDPSRRYPVLDYIYQGPQRLQTPKALGSAQYWSNGTRLWEMQGLAELGFVVVTIDGMGTPYRSKAFHDVAFRNLGDAGLPDHIAALRQLADRNPYLDLNRVGIFGHSAGGYASAHAILQYPDFFKVAVSSAGNHDHRTDKAIWVERYMGFPVGDHYREQANPTLAAKLKGRLLLMHGELDENVHPAATLQLADALVRANRNFDLAILPGQTHAMTDHPYFIRRRWDYFVQHLLGIDPPWEFELGGKPER